jgi:hypothetical protein
VVVEVIGYVLGISLLIPHVLMKESKKNHSSRKNILGTIEMRRSKPSSSQPLKYHTPKQTSVKMSLK